MDIRVREIDGQHGIEVTIVSAPHDARVPRIVERLQSFDAKIIGYAPDGAVGKRVIPLDDVVFVETSERRVLIHTKSGVTFESPIRLFELEEALEGTEFVRGSRQVLLNFDHVVAIRPELNGRLVLEMGDGTNLLVSRGYANDIKHKIGAVR